ncbi:DUF6176 family protein [Acinetobacter baylyi]|uniref:DUF6176 family protein n=1 Tax=Acinetobacter baylyi TaxID=202950 RepID=UPI0031DFAD6D
MDVGAVLIRLKPDSLQEVEHWQRVIEERKFEAIQTLQAEGVHIESWFYVELEGQHYLIAYMRAKDLAHAQKIAKSSPFEIDHIHRQFKKNWDAVYSAKLLIDLENQNT